MRNNTNIQSLLGVFFATTALLNTNVRPKNIEVATLFCYIVSRLCLELVLNEYWNFFFQYRLLSFMMSTVILGSYMESHKKISNKPQVSIFCSYVAFCIGDGIDAILSLNMDL